MSNNDFEVRIIQDKKETVFKARRGRRLKELILSAGISFAFPCGGNGRCGKCVISFEKGAPTPGDIDKNFLSEAELNAGKRILCRCILEKECVIRVDGSGNEEDIAVENIVADSAAEKSIGMLTGDDKDMARDSGKAMVNDWEYDKFGAAIDLGTTTIAAALVGLGTGDKSSAVLRTASLVNHQRQYGFDVISRIEAASDTEKARELQKTARRDIAEVFVKLLDGTKIKLSELCIAGNTTMLHLLRGYDVSGLGSFPYKPVNTGIEILDAKDLLGDEADEDLSSRLSGLKVTLMPGISAYVGADMVSGMYELDMKSCAGQKLLFLDLGTNGEMAYYDGKELYVTSTAAGPVFEGGGISCGVASVPGAVSHVSITRKESGNFSVDYETISDISPIGLCGTGVIETVSELARNGIIDKEGLLSKEFFDDGFVIDEEKNIRITQKDIRSVQLAKAAIRAGVDRLLHGDVPDKVYIAGGLGANLDVKKLFYLKMFPDRLLDKAGAVGNTSLKGCVRYLGENNPEKVERIADAAKETVLALENGFGEAYIESMRF